MKHLKITISAICCILLSSCNWIDFSENCTYYGNVEIKPDWSGLTDAETKPSLTDIYFLSPQVNSRYQISADTLVKDVQAVTYKVLALNSYNLTDIHFEGMDCPETAKAELETYQKDQKLYTVQAPTLYAANTNLTVPAFETVVCEPVLQSAVRQVYIDFVVVDNTNTGVNTIGGELSGIAYRYGFKQLEQLESSAWLAFGSERNTEKSNVFSSYLKVFGVNPDKQASNKIDNLLGIHLQMSDGSAYRKTIDLTDIFSGFTTRVIHISIQIRLALMGMEVEVTGWNVSDGGSIAL